MAATKIKIIEELCDSYESESDPEIKEGLRKKIVIFCKINKTIPIPSTARTIYLRHLYGFDK